MIDLVSDNISSVENVMMYVLGVSYVLASLYLSLSRGRFRWLGFINLANSLLIYCVYFGNAEIRICGLTVPLEGIEGFLYIYKRSLHSMIQIISGVVLVVREDRRGKYLGLYYLLLGLVMQTLNILLSCTMYG
ncbi:MAG TPA: hypothetical protein PLQ76_02920 [bacterium]|nr:hypothetical protein [bacterium]